MDSSKLIDNPPNENPPKLSKKQIKKQKRDEKWQKIKLLKKQQKKDKKKLIQTNPPPPNDPSLLPPATLTLSPLSSSLPSSALLLQTAPTSHRPTRTQKDNYKVAILSGQPIIIDCSFQSVMTEKEIKSLCLQLAYCHSANRKFGKCAKLILSDFNGAIKNKLFSMNVENWGIILEDKHYLNFYEKEKLVYLTGDAEEEMNEIEEE